MPKLWNETIEAHRRDVRAAILDTTAALVAEHGLASVTMSQIAQAVGIGRATLYKYFPDVEATLRAWHERQVNDHLAQLVRARDSARPGTRLPAVLQAYARLARHGHHDIELAELLHRGPHVARAHQRLRDLVKDLVAEAASRGEVRDDVPPAELAGYCLDALAAARHLASAAAVHRLVQVTLAGLRPDAPVGTGTAPLR